MNNFYINLMEVELLLKHFYGYYSRIMYGKNNCSLYALFIKLLTMHIFQIVPGTVIK